MNPLDLLETPIRGLLRFLHTEGGLTYGWAIVTVTVIVRVILVPLAVQQIKGMKKMQEHNPAIQEIRRKFANDKAKQQEEMMRLFRENKINPLASCLPLVAQFPVFIALYYVLRNSFKTGSSFLAGQGNPRLDFMWVIPNISKHLAQIGAGAYILVAIYALSQLLSTEVSASPQMSPTQRKLMRFIPLLVVLFVFVYPVPSGLVIYWVTTNLWTCAQMLVIKRMIGLRAPVLVAPVPEGGPAPQRIGRSRTLPQSAPAVAPEPKPPAPPKTPRRRRGGTPAPAAQAEGNGAGEQPRRRAPRPRPGGEPQQAPEPQAAPEPPPAPADGADGAGAPDQAAPTAGGPPADGPPEQAPKGQRQSGDGAPRRQPKARGKGGGGSSSGRRPPRKRR